MNAKAVNIFTLEIGEKKKANGTSTFSCIFLFVVLKVHHCHCPWCFQRALTETAEKEATPDYGKFENKNNNAPFKVIMYVTTSRMLNTGS